MIFLCFNFIRDLTSLNFVQSLKLLNLAIISLIATILFFFKLTAFVTILNAPDPTYFKIL